MRYATARGCHAYLVLAPSDGRPIPRLEAYHLENHGPSLPYMYVCMHAFQAQFASINADIKPGSFTLFNFAISLVCYTYSFFSVPPRPCLSFYPSVDLLPSRPLSRASFPFLFAPFHRYVSVSTSNPRLHWRASLSASHQLVFSLRALAVRTTDNSPGQEHHLQTTTTTTSSSSSTTRSFVFMQVNWEGNKEAVEINRRKGRKAMGWHVVKRR